VKYSFPSSFPPPRLALALRSQFAPSAPSLMESWGSNCHWSLSKLWAHRKASFRTSVRLSFFPALLLFFCPPFPMSPLGLVFSVMLPLYAYPTVLLHLRRFFFPFTSCLKPASCTGRGHETRAEQAPGHV